MPAGPVNNPPWATGAWSDTAWEANTWSFVEIALAFVLDLNTRLRVYLSEYYSLPATADTTAMTQRYLAAQTGEYNARFQKLIRDATDAMS